MQTGRFLSLIFKIYSPHQRNMNEAELSIEYCTESDESWGNIRVVGDERSSRRTRRQQGVKLNKQNVFDTDTSSEEQKEYGTKSSLHSTLMMLERRFLRGLDRCRRSISSFALIHVPAATNACLCYGADCMLKALYILRLPRTAEALVMLFTVV